MDEYQIHGGGESFCKIVKGESFCDIVKFGTKKGRVIHGAGRSEKSVDTKKLYICSAESSCPGYRTAYVVRAIDFDDLLMRRPISIARRMAVLPGNDLPVLGGCGVVGSKIIFAGGLTPGTILLPTCKIVCAFDIHDPKKGIIRLPQTLNGGKEEPVMVEFAGKLYVLSGRSAYNDFEVFDPDMATWSALPRYPYPNGGIPYSYVLAGSKLFVSSPYKKASLNICCFDLAAQKQEWKSVSTMCNGKPFPFFGKGLVLDVEELHPNQKLLFALKYDAPSVTNYLVVYIMSLDEDQEDITEIYETKLPAEFPNVGDGYHFFHLGGKDVCLVNCFTDCRLEDDIFETFETIGAAMRFEFDICKKNKHSNYSISVKFQPSCRFEYEGSLSHFLITCSSHRLACLVALCSNHFDFNVSVMLILIVIQLCIDISFFICVLFSVIYLSRLKFVIQLSI